MRHVKEVSKSKMPAVAAEPILKPVKKAPSDRRLKRNVVALRNALDTLLQLRGVTFEYNETGQKRGCPAGARMGMIAQDVEKVIPEWVEVASDGYREIGVHGFEALAVEALRELKTENDELR
ncbi:MAG: tail fiber domain-containing protein, partial [Candidatus Hydrogenedentales bacterium]